MRNLFAIIAVLCACFGAARAQDAGKAEFYPQLGHSNAVLSVAFSPDGKTLASGGEDKAIKLWDVASGRELRTLTGHGYEVTSVIFLPDKKTLASAGDRKIILWDVTNGHEIRTLLGHTGPVYSMGLSPNGRTLATGSDDHTIRLWDVASGTELHKLSVHSDFVGSVAFSPDGKTLASGYGEGTVTLWDVASGRELRTLTGHVGNVTSVAFSPDGRTLASADSGGVVRLWDSQSGGERGTLTGQLKEIHSITFSPDGKILASGGGWDKTTIELWDVATGTELDAPHTGTFTVWSIAFSPDGETLAAGNFDNAIELWSWRSGLLLRRLTGRAEPVNAVAVSPNGKVLASALGSGDEKLHKGAVVLRDVESGHILGTLTVPGLNGVSFATFSPDGKTLAMGSFGSIKLWDIASERELSTVSQFSKDVRATAAFSPDSKLLAFSGPDNSVKLWDVVGGRELNKLAGHTMAVSAVAFSPDGKTLASSDPETVKIWSVESGRELYSLAARGSFILTWVESIAFSPDGKTLAACISDDTIKFWDVASGRELFTLKGQSIFSDSIAFSPDGKTIASGTDGAIELWDIATRSALRTLMGSSALVSSVAFLSDGKTVMSGSIDGTTRLWDVATGKERVSLIAFDDGSSIAVTPEGYFDSSSPDAEENLNVRIGNRVFGISSFRDRFDRPDLVKAAIAGEDLSKYGSLDDVKLSPVVELAGLPATTKNGDIAFDVRFTNGGGGFGPVRVFANGVAMQQDSSLSASGDMQTRHYTLPLLRGTNEVRVTASNNEGTMASATDASVLADLPPPAKVSGANGTLYALVVGIDTFPKATGNNLKYAGADATLFVDTLRKYAAPLFANLDILPLTAPGETDKAHIEDALKAMEAKAGPDDAFVLFIASHGEIYNGEYYVISANAGAPDRFPVDAIGGQELAGLLSNIKASKKLLVLDTCHAGAALSNTPADAGLSTETSARILGHDTGITVLAAAASSQEAVEDRESGHGLFTYVLTNGLSGKALDAKSVDGIVDTMLIGKYLKETVPVAAQAQYGHKQEPVTEPGPKNFAITKVR